MNKKPETGWLFMLFKDQALETTAIKRNKETKKSVDKKSKIKTKEES